MSSFNFRKYTPYPRFNKNNRRWPNEVIQQAPIWCSVDLRDGNQALIEPMTPDQKLALFKLLVNVGFKEIEVGFPAASQLDFDFVRQLIEENLIPNDVTIQVLTQAREPLIARSFEALVGAKQVVMHLYNSTSTLQREKVFGKSKNAIKMLAVQGAQWIKKYAAQQSGTSWRFQYSPESFTGTEMDYAVEVCNAVNTVWTPSPENPVIINLPATVEMTTPNVYADQIEWVCEHIENRHAIIISLHTHNDRGCGIAAAELGIMAGADRIEGTLLGNGERTGNMDIVTLAMNLYSQGINPQLDLSQMDQIIHTVETCTRIKCHPRHPYAGELVFAAFSGSHQDAINKCLPYQNEGENNKPVEIEQWEVPYLPIDPRDIGRSYQEVIRINSQSGKGGIAYTLKQHAQLQLPRWLQIDFSPHVQQLAEKNTGELPAPLIKTLFFDTYVDINGVFKLNNYKASYANGQDKLSATIAQNNTIIAINGQGNGMLDAFINGLNTTFNATLSIIEYNEHSLGGDEESDAIAYIQLNTKGRRMCGAACSSDIVKASFQAVLNAMKRGT